ncbi:unnamed protein product [Trichogramma brassicae]|uniref:Uncharacterized protein n=1 Tax=Trichogramma brassicae TaxID=86971 RepID=A0A6H5IVI1_9HYME|nr:unnamed protein product [Trichogramma brassicae]
MRYRPRARLARSAIRANVLAERLQVKLTGETRNYSYSRLDTRDDRHLWSVLYYKRNTCICAGSDRITISRSPRRGLTKLAIDGAQHSHDEVRSENHTHKRAPDAGAKAQQERMMAPEARTTLTR